MSTKKNKAIELPEVNFSEDGESRYLHLGTPWIQGAMKIKEPFELDLEYIQRMMVGLLFFKSASVSGRHAMQLGLGAASLTKFCYKKLRWTCTAIELNPGVLHACRGWFKLPEDGPRMRVIIADAAEEILSDEWQGTVDVLHVDLYDHEAAAPVLDSVDFYRNCRALLADEGTMTVNLFGRSASYDQSVAKMAEAFGEDALWAFKPTREGNTVVMAQRQASRPKRADLMAQAEAIENRFDLPATKWLRVFKPLIK
jgi:spermidine synthase